ncbi:uncharacterized protein [Elaeis guineensis]|uniref:Uncharacterized protein LOC105044280 n=1 Tax=Elaeis guineensis var. tenera TaxID=51953 RepID=A0A6I9R4D3_ELAGV|nr:uncharacterized protein LOC105044280 [Elaeis guineensis]
MDSREQDGGAMSGVIEDLTSVHQGKRPNLSIEIPPRSMGVSSMNLVKKYIPSTPGSVSTRVNNLPTCSPASARIQASPCSSSSKARPSIKNLLPGLSFKFRSSALEIEKDDVQVLEASSGGRREKPSVLRSFSFTKIFSPTVRRTSSLPTDPPEVLDDNTFHEASVNDSISLEKKEFQRHISRSLSLPSNAKSIKTRSIKRMDSLGGVLRVIPSTPQVVGTSAAVPEVITAVDCEIGDDGEDIPEEEAVCRICMIELSEGSDTLKLECNCKGDLALAHQECAMKWFSIKGNRNCEVCKQEVQNLPVTLLRIRSVQTSATRTGNTSNQTTVYRYRFWHDMPILVIVSMLAYFCFLEQLLVADNGTAALAISLPFSCILGLFASLTSSTMVMKRYIWVYAAVQFLLVVFFAHLFYSYFHMQTVISIILATFAGFGVAMSVSSLVVELLRWRRRWLAGSENHRRSQGTGPTPRPVTSTNHPHPTAELDGVNIEIPVMSQA